MFTVIYYPTQANFNSLAIDLHIPEKLMETNGSGKMKTVSSNVRHTGFAVEELKRAEILVWSYKL